MNDKMRDSIESGAQALLVLFGENAPENAAYDIVDGYVGLAEIADEERWFLAEHIWERYHDLIKHREV